MKHKTKSEQAAKKMQISKKDWCFSSVPRKKLVACCYWEYARESQFIRNVVQELKQADTGINRPRSREDVTRDWGKLSTNAQLANLLYRLPFPKPWHELTASQKLEGVNCVETYQRPTHPAPFQPTNDVGLLGELYKQAQENAAKQRSLLLQLNEAEDDIKKSGEIRSQIAALNGQEPCLEGAGGVFTFAVQINLRDFSNPDIKTAINHWVDGFFRKHQGPSKRGHKAADWRTRLERLGFLRLRYHYSVDDTISIIARTLPVEKRNKEKYNEPGECNREAQAALTEFRTLFPFLDPEEKPLCWRQIIKTKKKKRKQKAKFKRKRKHKAG